MRKLIGYTLMVMALAFGFVWLALAFCRMDCAVIFLFGAGGMVVAGCAICCDEFFGITLPKRGKRKSRR